MRLQQDQKLEWPTSFKEIRKSNSPLPKGTYACKQHVLQGQRPYMCHSPASEWIHQDKHLLFCQPLLFWYVIFSLPSIVSPKKKRGWSGETWGIFKFKEKQNQKTVFTFLKKNLLTLFNLFTFLICPKCS